MFTAIRERLENEDGFTLIELLVVVIIIGILAAIAIPTFLNQRERGYQAELTSSVRNYALEIEAQATKGDGTYPTNLNVMALPAGLTAGGKISVTYNQTGSGSGFTLCGTTTKIATANRVRYVTGSGVQTFEETAC